MGLLGQYKQASASAPAEQTAEAPSSTVGKGRRTPTRAEAEAARMAALHPNLTKKQMADEERRARALRQQRALAAADAQPQKVLLRNYVDSRWNLTEFAWPLMLLVVVTLFVGGTVSLVGGFLLYGFMLASFINVWINWRGFKYELYLRYPGASTKGLAWTMVQRMLSMRRFRQPGPAIPRGGTY